MQHSEALQRLLDSLRADITEARVLEAIATTPREVFVPPELARHAYENRPLPVGEGQTISQPLIVATMLQALAVEPSDAVLDVGTGTGYQAALLSKLAARVVTVERTASLAERARRNLGQLGISNVTVVEAGRELGFPMGGPYNAIVVGAAASSVPAGLVAELAPGGRLVMPVGMPFMQQLVLVRATENGPQPTWLGACQFAPLIGDEGWDAGLWESLNSPDR
ncbi:MAG: protein-L-isoaspartate(D-aspartate) O-methyltransferase [SAR202 cluster bacterium]|nr:protein-L-isoaspartate(D-aspartate) O-methyltransferase [SAR202 cluster bacterium]